MSLLGLPFSKATLIAGGLLLLGVIVQAGVIVGQAKTIGRLESQSRGQLAELAQCQTDLGASLVDRQAIQAAHLACMDEIRITKDENATQRQSIDQLAAHIRQESASVHREREVIYRQPECRELAVLDIAAVCPDLASSLRARAIEVSAPREGGNPRTGGP